MRQHLSCLVVNDSVAVDAGSLAFAATDRQRRQIRDVVLTHAHLDHIAGLPIFIDDLFATLDSPVRIHASDEIIETLERDIFNWSVYPRFSELTNDHGPVVEYRSYAEGAAFKVCELEFLPVRVNHKVPAYGFIVEDGRSTIAISGDTAAMEGFWNEVNARSEVTAVVLECAFPDELSDLADRSFHMTPSKLLAEICKFGKRDDCPIFVFNIKPMYRERVAEQLARLGAPNLHIVEVGKTYFW